MKSILFVCLGNICRSPMAEFYFRHRVQALGLDSLFAVASAATSDEELGNTVYPLAQRTLAAHGISCQGKTARQMTADDYSRYDFIVCMDHQNLNRILRLTDGDPLHKVSLLLSHVAPANRLHPDLDVADPWYTRRFEDAWDDITLGCDALLEELSSQG